MAFSEAPEILTLTNDTSNDCEAVQVWHQSRRAGVADEARRTAASWKASGLSEDGRAAYPHGFLSHSSVTIVRNLLVLLVTQRQ